LSVVGSQFSMIEMQPVLENKNDWKTDA